MPSSYWVNQGTWYDAERKAGCISAPTKGDNGEKVRHWTVLGDMQPGDLTVHYVQGMIRAVGIVAAAPTIGPRPYERPGHPLHPSVYTVAIRYVDLETPLPLSAIPHDDRVAEGRIGPYRVFNKNGLVNQIYCGEISERIVEIVRAKIAPASGSSLSNTAPPTAAAAPVPAPFVAPPKQAAAPPASGAGVDDTAAVRTEIERHVMTEAASYFRLWGWSVRDVSRSEPYDLLCTKPNATDLHVVVKGTTGSAANVFLTHGEVAHARGHAPDVALFVLAGVVVDTRGGLPAASGGTQTVLHPWEIDRGTLRPIQFEYELPGP